MAATAFRQVDIDQIFAVDEYDVLDLKLDHLVPVQFRISRPIIRGQPDTKDTGVVNRGGRPDKLGGTTVHHGCRPITSNSIEACIFVVVSAGKPSIWNVLGVWDRSLIVSGTGEEVDDFMPVVEWLSTATFDGIPDRIGQRAFRPFLETIECT